MLIAPALIVYSLRIKTKSKMFRTPVSFFIKLRQLLDVTLDAVYHYRLLWTDHNDFPGGFHPFHLLQLLIIDNTAAVDGFTQ